MRFEYPSATLTRAVDGDTVHLSVDVGFGMTFKGPFRLAHIDSHERGSPEGAVSTGYMKAKEGGKFALRSIGKDKWGRWLAELIKPDGTTLNEEMLAAGHATPYEGGKRDAVAR